MTRTFTFCFLFLIFFGFSAVLASPVGWIKNLDGRVERLPAGNLGWDYLKPSDRIFHNDRVRTYDNSFCELFFEDSSYVRIGSGTTLLYNFSLGATSSNLERIFFMQGQQALFHAPASSGEFRTFMRIYAGSQRISLGNGKLKVQMDSLKTRFSMLEGTAWYNDGQGLERQLGQGQILTVSQDGIMSLDTLNQVTQTKENALNTTVTISDSSTLVSRENKTRILIPSWVVPPNKVFEWNAGSSLPDLLMEDSVPPPHEFVRISRIISNPRALEEESKLNQNMLTGRINDFILVPVGKMEWLLKVDIDLDLYDLKSGIRQKSWKYQKEFSGNVSEPNLMNLIKYLPLKTNNLRIKECFLIDFLNDFKKEVVRKLTDPFEGA